MGSNQINSNKSNSSNNLEKKEFVTTNYIKDYISSEISNNVKTNFGNSSNTVSSSKVVTSIKVDFPTTSTEKKNTINPKPNSSLKISCLMSPTNSAMTNITSNINISAKNNTSKGKLSEVKLNDFRPSQILAKPQISTKPKTENPLQKFKK